MNVSTALERLKEKGYKYTGKREMMLRMFASERRYLSAKDVLQEMQKEYPGLSVDTIYRNLSLFDELDLLECTELDGERRYRFSCETPHHHHHLICMMCGKTRHIHACPMDWMEENVENDFMITDHKFEVYGYCNQCVSKQEQTSLQPSY